MRNCTPFCLFSLSLFLIFTCSCIWTSQCYSIILDPIMVFFNKYMSAGWWCQAPCTSSDRREPHTSRWDSCQLDGVCAPSTLFGTVPNQRPRSHNNWCHFQPSNVGFKQLFLFLKYSLVHNNICLLICRWNMFESFSLNFTFYRVVELAMMNSSVVNWFLF